MSTYVKNTQFISKIKVFNFILPNFSKMHISSFTEKYVIKPGFWASVGWGGCRRVCIPPHFLLHILQKIFTLLSQN